MRRIKLNREEQANIGKEQVPGNAAIVNDSLFDVPRYFPAN